MSCLVGDSQRHIFHGMAHKDIHIGIHRVATGQGKVREISFFFKVREKSGNFANWSGNFKYQESRNSKILAQIMCCTCSRYFDYLKCEKVLIFFSRSLKAMKTC